ncbi:OmpP1/FadL family transporter, partial [Sedimenticola selenatireducens]|uniref:OmpP1/FadL family transporter n=1 Tax=Sedimenticola selenatireducens TaxID=191960 RepID=UPI0004B12DDB
MHLKKQLLAAATNPAGMVHVGNRMDLGAEWFRPIRSADVSGNGGGGNGHHDGSDTKNFIIPEFGYNRMLDENSSFGVSVFGNGGMNTDYKDGFTLFNGAAYPTRTGVDLAQLFIVPTYAFKLNENHSLGIGLNLAVQTFEALGLQNFDQAAFSADLGNVTDNGHDISYGAGIRLGWQGKVSDSVTLGATYQTRTYMTEFDDYSGLFAEQGDFDIPENYAIGIAVQATPKLVIAADVMRINYADINAINNGGPTTNPNAFTANGRLGTDGGLGFGWEDQTVYKLGIAYQYSPQLTLRAGYNHADQPIPAAETLFNMLAPATVEDHLTLGATWVLDNGSELTFSYMHAFENSVKGSGSIPAAFGSGEADLKMYQDSIGIAYSWKM